MYLTIIKNNRTIDHRNLNVECLSFRKSSLSPTNSYETVEGKHGLIPTGTVWGGRKLVADFLIQAVDHIDLQLLIDELMDIFSTEEEMGLIDSRQPAKIWYAKVNGEFTPEQINRRSGKFTIEFLSSIPYCRSLGSTLTDPIDYGNDQWQAIGGGLVSDEDLIYHFNTDKFKVFNGGVKLDPKDFPLVISYKGSSSNLQINNKTTGDVFTYSGTTKSTDTLELNRVRHLLNGVSVFADTNHKRISLASGWNEFELTGVTGTFMITFDFHYWYK